MVHQHHLGPSKGPYNFTGMNIVSLSLHFIVSDNLADPFPPDFDVWQTGFQLYRLGSPWHLTRVVNVALATHRPYYQRFLRIDLDLPTDAGNPDVDAAVKRIPCAVMRALEYLVTVQNPALIASKELQQVEFHRGQRNFGPVLRRQPSGVNVKPRLAKAKSRALGQRVQRLRGGAALI